MSITFGKPPLFSASCVSQKLAQEVERFGGKAFCRVVGSDRLSRLLRVAFPSTSNFKIESRLMIPFVCRNWIKTLSPADIVWIYTNGKMVNPISDACIEKAIKRKGARYIFHLPDAWPVLPSRLKDACDRRVRLADLTVAVTPQLTELLRNTYPGIRCETAEEAIDTDVIKPVDEQNRSGKKVVLWSGPPGKRDLVELRNVLESVHQSVPFVLRVVSGSTRPDYNFSFPWEWIPFNQATQNNAFSGVDVAIAYYGESPYERCKGNFKVKKYMAAGIPVVTSDVGYNRVLIKSGENGILVENKPNAWEVALLHVLQTPDMACRLGKSARTSVVERYSYSAVAKSYLNILQKHFPEELEKCRISTREER